MIDQYKFPKDITWTNILLRTYPSYFKTLCKENLVGLIINILWVKRFNIICISAKNINRKVIYSLLFQESFLQANSTNFQRKESCIFITKNINFYFNCSMHLHSIFRVISFRKEKRYSAKNIPNTDDFQGLCLFLSYIC